MARVTRNGRAKQPTRADLRRLLAEAVARAEAAEAALVARPAAGAPAPGGHCPGALLAAAKGAMRVWLMTDANGYRLRLVRIGADGCGWEMIKWGDGTRYHLSEPEGGELVGDCPGCAAHGPGCNGGKGCKHIRMLRALRQLVDPGV
ncbi:MAG TPA: hypothetical protein VIL46_17420 [Gemmataceae bacterium]